MVWEEVEFLGDVGSRLKHVLNTKPVSRLQNFLSSSPSSAPILWDSRSKTEEVFDAGADRQEFCIARKESVRFGLNTTPTTSKLFSKEASIVSGKNTSDEEEYIFFPSYDSKPQQAQQALPSERIPVFVSKMPSSHANISRDTVDDTCLQYPPTMHVDYLSHEWAEEDIWTSWRRLNSERPSQNANRPRLENASWRSWAKTRSNLGTIPAKSINWTKDEDVTWLYGPLHTRSARLCPNVSPDHVDFDIPEGILKTPSLEEVLLQRSVSELALNRHLLLPSLDSSRASLLKPAMSRSSTLPISITEVRQKTVTFRDEVVQCISIGDENLVQEFPLSRKTENAGCVVALPKTIEPLPSTTLKPAATPQSVFQRAASWPIRTLNYFWNESSLPLSRDSPAPSSLPQIVDPKHDVEEGEEEEVENIHWNPPHPRQTASEVDFTDVAVFAPTITPMSPQVDILTEEESFEIEMFGSSAAQPKKSDAIEEPESETQSNRSSPSISDHVSTSSEDLDDVDVEFPPSLFGALSPNHEEGLRSPTFGQSGLMAAAISNNLKRHSTAPCSPFCTPSAAVKDHSAWASSSDSVPAYGTPSYAAEASDSMDSGMATAMAMDDEEYWWMNV